MSGYRTQQKQQSLYDEKIAKFKAEGYSDSETVEQAKQWVAVPGYSEHQLGFAVDINGATYTSTYGCRKTAINMDLFSDTPVIKRTLPGQWKKYGITDMWEKKQQKKFMIEEFVWKNI